MQKKVMTIHFLLATISYGEEGSSVLSGAAIDKVPVFQWIAHAGSHG